MERNEIGCRVPGCNKKDTASAVSFLCTGANKGRLPAKLTGARRSGQGKSLPRSTTYLSIQTPHSPIYFSQGLSPFLSPAPRNCTEKCRTVPPAARCRTPTASLSFPHPSGDCRRISLSGPAVCLSASRLSAQPETFRRCLRSEDFWLPLRNCRYWLRSGQTPDPHLNHRPVLPDDSASCRSFRPSLRPAWAEYQESSV